MSEDHEWPIHLEAFVTEEDNLSLFDFESGNGLLIPMEQAERLAAMILAYRHDLGGDVMCEPEAFSGCRMFRPKEEAKP